ncbi:MAG: glycosyltransferase family 9 protein, partial [Spartobacteria bacterium]
SDAALLEALKAEFGLQAVMLTGQLGLLSLGFFLRKCAVVLCPDSGPRHLANAVETPVVFVRNFAVGRIETGAYCETEIDAAPPELERVVATDQVSAFERLSPENVAEFVRQRVPGTDLTRS